MILIVLIRVFTQNCIPVCIFDHQELLFYDAFQHKKTLMHKTLCVNTYFEVCLFQEEHAGETETHDKPPSADLLIPLSRPRLKAGVRPLPQGER